MLLKDAVNGQLLIRDVPAGNHGSCIHLGLDIYFDEYNYLDSLQVHLTEELATQFVSIV